MAISSASVHGEGGTSAEVLSLRQDRALLRPATTLVDFAHVRLRTYSMISVHCLVGWGQDPEYLSKGKPFKSFRYGKIDTLACGVKLDSDPRGFGRCAASRLRKVLDDYLIRS